MTGRKGHYPKWKPKTEQEQIDAHAQKLQRLSDAHKSRRPVLYRYEKMIDLVKGAGHLGRPAKVAEFIKGPRTEIQGLAKRERRNLAMWLERNRPLEMWNVQILHTPGTWSYYELWVTWNGDHANVVEADKWKAARKKEYWASNRNIAGIAAAKEDLIRKTAPLRG